MKILMMIVLLGVSSLAFSQQVYQATPNDSADIIFDKVKVMNHADLLVYIADSSCTEVKDGVWYMVSDTTQASFVYGISAEASDSNIKVFFVNSPQEAGWRTTDKKEIYFNARKRL